MHKAITRNWIRNFCYKPVKRPDLFSSTENLRSKLVKETTSSSVARTTLTNQLRSRILATGPITVADYMKEVLTNPAVGYYMSRDVFGASGDFITSPEIGQIFGELLAIWFLTEWQKVGSPSPFQFIELGPGRGTLSQDILRVFSHFNLGNELSLHLVEISPHLSEIQAQRLCFNHHQCDSNTTITDDKSLCYRKGETVSGIQVYWYQKLEDVPLNRFSMVLAHEFFDVLPIHKLQYDNGIWREVLIDIDSTNEQKFCMILSNSQTPVSQLYQPIENDSRNCLEYSLEMEKIIKQLVERFECGGGFGLIVDYGHFGEKTDTFRAFKNHKLHDPLIEPGSADLTADVDFKILKAIAERGNTMITFGPVEQGTFLKRMNSEKRLKILLENCLPENKESIKTGYKMLTSPTQMGSRFKFFSIFPAVLKNHLKKFPVSGFSETSQK